MPRFTNLKKISSKGFTLLETLVAIAIVMLAIGSAFGLVPEGLIGARFAKNQTTATYLVQEAMEEVHNLRDNTMFFSANPSDPLNWLSALSACIDKLCTIDAVSGSVQACSTKCPPMDVRLDDSGSIIYSSHTNIANPSNAPSIFTREITIKKINNATIGRDDTEAQLTARVRWDEGSVTKTTEMKETLFDWWTFNK